MLIRRVSVKHRDHALLRLYERLTISDNSMHEHRKANISDSMRVIIVSIRRNEHVLPAMDMDTKR